MTSIMITGGNTEEIDQTFSGEISDIDIQDGVLNIVNQSDDGMVLSFSESAKIDVGSFGQFNVLGKLKEIGVSDGLLGQVFPNWQVTDQISALWIEKAQNTGEYEKWLCIDIPNNSSMEFADFADSEETGRVFKWNGGNIAFATVAGSSSVPGVNCKIMTPNIVFTTVGGFLDSGAASFGFDGGGRISLSYCSFSDFKTNLRGHSKVSLNKVAFFSGTVISYCNDITAEDIGISPSTQASTGLTISYTASAVLSKIKASSYSAAGIVFSYAKGVVGNDIQSISLKRNSTLDSSFWLKVLSGSKLTNLIAVGGKLFLDESSGNKISNITLIDKPNMIESTSYAVPNLDVLSSAGNKITNVNVPNGGGGRIAGIRTKNSPNCDFFGLRFSTAHSNNVLNVDTSFNTRFVDIEFDGFASSTPFLIPSKNNGMLIQNINPAVKHDFLIESIDTDIKGVYANSVNTYFNGIKNLFMTQLYTSETEGELNLVMARDTIGGKYTILSGSPRWSNNGRVYMGLAGDSFEFGLDWKLKGITLQDAAPIITGVGYGNILFEYSIDGNSMKEFTQANLATETISEDEGFNLTIRLTASADNSTAYISNIKLLTNDSRYVYPVDFERGRIIFDESFQLDPNASYGLLFSNSHGTDLAEVVEDGEGSMVAGPVDGQSYVDFTFDYVNNNQSLRIPGEPVEMMLVVTGQDMAQAIYITQVFSDDGLNIFNARTEPELSYTEAE